jgi:hypothetical protein
MLRFNHRLIAFTASKSLSQRADVLVDSGILDHHIAPNRGDYLFSLEKRATFFAGVLQHVFENLSRRRSQLNLLAAFEVQVAFSQIEPEGAEEITGGTSLIHAATE